MRTAVHRNLPPWGHALLVACLSASPSAVHAQDGFLQQMRDNVRAASDSSVSPQPDKKADDDGRRKHSPQHHHSDDDCGGWGECAGDTIGGWICLGALVGITSPIWGPYKALGDDLHAAAFFPGYPYDDVPGYLVTGRSPFHSELDSEQVVTDDDPLADYFTQDPPRSRPRTWAGRIRFDYADGFDDLDRVSGHLLFSTTSRFGLDTETSYLREALPGGFHDQLWLGDCNLIFRFAQSERAQFRAGVGFNWLDDRVATNYGFNFTYGADFFPRKPWIVSSTVDWGSLGSAELFRFRASVGLIVHRIEVYTGYEYLDVDDSQFNGLTSGVRIWF